MNERITVRLSTTQIVHLKKYAKDCSITFSAALREHIVIASRELDNREEEEAISTRLEKIESAIKDLDKSLSTAKLTTQH